LLKALKVAALLCFSAASNAADIRGVELRPGAGMIRIVGEIVAGDEIVFAREASRFRDAIVVLESPGGNLTAGLGIGDQIAKRQFHTGIAPGSHCTSACALAWVAGTSRTMSRSARIGFHAAYRMSSDGASVSSSGNALVGAYLARLGLPDRAIVFMTSAQPREMAWLDSKVANQFGIDVQELDVTPSTSAKPARSFVRGLDPNGDNWLALKAGPALSTQRIAKLPPGELLIVLDVRGDWKKVTIENGQEGWVHGKYVGCCR
jgi:hypothetical protein